MNLLIGWTMSRMSFLFSSDLWNENQKQIIIARWMLEKVLIEKNKNKLWIDTFEFVKSLKQDLSYAKLLLRKTDLVCLGFIQ